MTTRALTDAALAVVLGGGFGLGVCLLLALAPRVGAVSLTRRLIPYVRDVIDPLGLAPAPEPIRGGDPLRTLGAKLIARLGGSEALARRIAQAGWRIDVGRYRAAQLLCTVGGLAVGGALVIMFALAGRFAPGLALLPALAAVGGWIACDARLSQAGRARVRRIEEELPTVLDFVALCLAAGEGIFDALRRVGHIGTGELTSEIRRAVLSVSAGQPLADALLALGQRMRIPALTRSLDQIVAALERGAPLAHVMRDQALDAREDAKRQLIEIAGRKEIVMLLPLVFLILPLSVLYAVFPGVLMLRLGIG